MKILSWNVNGLRAIARKGFLAWVEDYDPDVLLLQEIKARPADLPGELREIPGFFSRFFPAGRKGYSGVALYTRFEPDEWIQGLGEEEFDREGRALSARFGDVLVSSVYFPNSQAEGARLDYRLGFGAAVRRFCERQADRGRHVVLGGDFNVAHQPIDLARPQANTKNPGFLPEERAWFSEFLEAGFRDSFREHHPGLEGAYSWWSFRSGARERNIGWRIDYLCVSEGFWGSVRKTGILSEVMGSDHCPVLIDIRNPK